MIRNIAITISSFLAIAILSIEMVNSIATGISCSAQPDGISLRRSLPTTATEAQKETCRNGPPHHSVLYEWDLKFVTIDSSIHAASLMGSNGKWSGSDWRSTTAVRIPPISFILIPLLYPCIVLIYKPIRPKGTLGKASIQILLFISLSTFFFWLTTIGAGRVSLSYGSGGIAYYRSHLTTVSADILKRVPQSTFEWYDQKKIDIHVLSFLSHFRPLRFENIVPLSNNSFGVTNASDWHYSITLKASPLFLVFMFAAYPTFAFIRGPLRRHRRRRKGLCLKCGYDLTGNESGTCPECGSEVEPA